MTDEHNTDAADRRLHLAADREHVARLPAVRVMGATTALQEIVRQDNASLRIPALLHRLALDNLVSPSLRAWALILGELGPARLPGGKLVDVDGRPPAPVTRTIGPPDALTQPWLTAFREACVAAVARDGKELFTQIKRGMISNAVSFPASFGVSAVNAVEQLHARDEVLALACLLGHAGNSPQRWSVAGQCFRLCHAFLMTQDLGVNLGFAALAPEFESLANMSPDDRLTALEVMSVVAASIIGGDPAEPLDFELDITAAESGLSAEEAGSEQVAAAKLACRLITALRDPDPEAAGRIVSRMRGSESLWAMWGMGNMLSMRVGELWAAP